MTVDEVPAEADCVLIYAPSTDLSDEEVTMLEDYVAGGGKLLVSAGPTEDGTLTTCTACWKTTASPRPRASW